MTTLYLGFDNGLNGGAVAITEDREFVSKLRFEHTQCRWGKQLDSKPIHVWLSRFKCDPADIFALIEEPAKGQGPKTSAQAIQSTGVSFGKIVAVLEIANIRYVTITAMEWQKTYFKVGGADSKVKSIGIATGLFPGVDLRISDAAKKPHDGFCDAILIAEYARRLRM